MCVFVGLIIQKHALNTLGPQIGSARLDEVYHHWNRLNRTFFSLWKTEIKEKNSLFYVLLYMFYNSPLKPSA